MPARTVLLPLLAALAVAFPTAGDELVDTTGELQVNTFTSSYQGNPATAIGSDGEVLVVWEGVGATDDIGIWGQRLDPSGNPLGGEMRINATTAGYQFNPAVATDELGRFIVTWDGEEPGGGGSAGIFGQILAADGTPVGDEFQANTYTPNHQYYPAVAARADGSFLVVWESRLQDFSLGGVFGRVYDSLGDPIGDDFQVHSATAGNQQDARVAATPDGFVVVWESDLGDGNNEGILMQRLDAVGSFVGDETVVNAFTFGDQVNPDVAVSPDGTVAVVWEDTTQEGNGDGVYARIFDSSGVAIGVELQLNTYTTNDQENPRVASDGQGGFLAVWESKGQVDATEDEDVYGQRFDASGQLVGGEFQVNVQASYDQEDPAVAGRGGRFVVAWHSYPDLDGDFVGVFARGFEISLFADGFESGDLSAWGGP